MRRKNCSSLKNNTNYNSKNDSYTQANQRLRRRNNLWSSKRMSRSFDNDILLNDSSMCDEINDLQQDEILDKPRCKSIESNKNVFSTTVNESNEKVLENIKKTTENIDETIKKNDIIHLQQTDSFKAYLNVFFLLNNNYIYI